MSWQPQEAQYVYTFYSPLPGHNLHTALWLHNFLPLKGIFGAEFMRNVSERFLFELNDGFITVNFYL